MTGSFRQKILLGRTGAEFAPASGFLPKPGNPRVLHGFASLKALATPDPSRFAAPRADQQIELSLSIT
jgi:hypothetical protein